MRKSERVEVGGTLDSGGVVRKLNSVVLLRSGALLRLAPEEAYK